MTVHEDYVIDEGRGYFRPACSCGWRGDPTAFGAEKWAATHALYAEQGPTLAAQHQDRIAAERAAEFAESARIGGAA